MQKRPYIEVKLMNDGEVVHVDRRVIVRDEFGNHYALDPVTRIKYDISTGAPLSESGAQGEAGKS